MRKLRLHQEEAIQFLRNGSQYVGALLYHGMGLGKTFTSLTYAREILSNLKRQGVRAPKILVLIPKSASTTWRTEGQEFFMDIYNDMVMVPYSQMHKVKNLVMYYDIRVIIADESHNLKSPGADRAENLQNLLNLIGNGPGGFKGGKTILLSGTPMLNNGSELYTTWALCAAPDILTAALWLRDEEKFKTWTQMFSYKKENTWYEREGGQTVLKQGSEYRGIANVDKMQQLLGPVVHYKRVSDCLDLPTKTENYIDLKLPDDKLLEDADIEEPEAYMALVERLSVAKTPYLIDWVRDYISATDEQLVVFSQYREPIELLKQKFGKHIVLVHGQISSGERAANIQAFQQKQVRIIAMTYGAGSDSLNLQNASNALYHGYPWTDGRLKQAMARIFRQGQLKPTFHHFLMSGSNDKRILGLVREKEDATNEVEDMLLAHGNQIAPARKLHIDDFM